jgi:DNA-directed RNA polymerase subunit alpha
MTVEKGRGYSPASTRSSDKSIGELPVDAIYSPVLKIGFDVSNARVGQSTNYDKLTMEIWTDGTISPEQALGNASKILMEQLSLISGIEEELLEISKEPEVAEIDHLRSEAADTPIENLDLSVRVFNSLKRTGITSVGDVLELLDKGEEAVMSIRNFGEKSLTELREKMIEKGFLPEENETEAEN